VITLFNLVLGFCAFANDTLTTVLSANPITFNPLLINTIPDRQVEGFLFAPLFDVDGNSYELVPSIAESMSASADGKEYTVTLRRNATWSDGTPITADDVEYSVARILDPKVDAATLRSFLPGLQFKKIDQHKFIFSVPNPRFNTERFLSTTIPIIQKAQFLNEKDFNRSSKNLTPIGSGPYRVTSFRRDQQIELERNPDWWGFTVPYYKKRFKAKKIMFKILPDEGVAYEKWLRGDIDALPIVGSDIYETQVKGSDRDKIGTKAGSGKKVWAARFETQGNLGWYGVAWNLKHPVLKSKVVRQSLAQLLNSEEVVRKAWFGSVRRCVSPFGSVGLNVDPQMKAKKGLFSYDPKKALQMLRADGWADTDQDGVLDRMIDGRKVPLRITIQAFSGGKAGMVALQILKESARAAGVDIVIRSMEGTALFKNFDEGSFEGLFIGWGGGSIYPDPRQTWHSTSTEGSNKVGYVNPAVDRLIEQSDFERDKKKRNKLLQKIGKLLYEDQPYLFMVEKSSFVAGYREGVKSSAWSEKYSISPPLDLLIP
jgi:ABC-type transport system substrate-binding protein